MFARRRGRKRWQRYLPLAVLLVACGGSAPSPTLEHRGSAARAVLDTDGDRLADTKDRCPTLAEDFDLRDDADGCPELDDDGDGVPDLEDACFDLPGPDAGCPEGCSFVRTISDCFFMTPMWTETAPLADFGGLKQLLVEYPEIEQVTLVTGSGPAPQRRLERARRALVAAGVPAGKLAVGTNERVAASGSADVFGEITKQRYADGKFRSTHCAGGLGAVFRVARDVNYSCKPRICGDGECWRATEDDGSCPQDCPP